MLPARLFLSGLLPGLVVVLGIGTRPTTAELSQKYCQVIEFFRIEHRQSPTNPLRMGGEDPSYQAPAVRGQPDPDITSILGAAPTLYQTTFFQIIQDHGDITSGLQNFSGKILLAHRAAMIERLQYPELAYRQVLFGEPAVNRG